MENFEERLQLTDKIEKQLFNLFDGNETSIQRFGCETIVQENKDLENYIKQPEVNQQAAGMIVKFAPDFILLKKKAPQKLFFLDVKHSIAPIWADKRVEMIRKKNNDYSLRRAQIGIVAREALLSYCRYYPNTIILMASPYNPKLLMAQFADKVRCLYCYRNPSNGEYDCKNCPSKKGGFFDIERAVNSVGSQTPMTDIDLDSFEAIEDFFDKLEISVNEETLKMLKQSIRYEPIGFDSKVPDKVKNKVRSELRDSGCDWIDYEVYSKEGNNFFHFDRDCFILKNNNHHLETYNSLHHATQAGKRVKCHYCGTDYKG